MMNAIHIHTQVYENYGEPNAPYWKAKGGRTIVVTGFSHPLNDKIGAAAAAVVESVRGTIEQNNSMYEENIIDWNLADANDLTQFEQDQLEFDGRVDSRDQRIAIDQIAA